MRAIVNIPLLFAALIALLVLSGHVFTNLWGWFMTPLGLPPLGLAHALGIMLTFGFVVRGLAREKHYEELEGYTKAWTTTIHGYAIALVFWGVGYIYTLYM